MERKDYERTYWEDRVVDDSNGEVIVPGTLYDETNMNNIENGIEIALSDSGTLTAFLLQQMQSNQQELSKIKNQVIAQGSGTITNTISDNGYFRSSEPFKTIALEGYSQINAPDYDVMLTPKPSDESMGRVGELIAYDKTRNGFKVKMTGSADSVSFLWTLINPNV